MAQSGGTGRSTVKSHTTCLANCGEFGDARPFLHSIAVIPSIIVGNFGSTLQYGPITVDASGQGEIAEPRMATSLLFPRAGCVERWRAAPESATRMPGGLCA